MIWELTFEFKAKLLLEKLGPWAIYRFYQTNIRAIQRQTNIESRPVFVVFLEMLATTLRKLYMICDERIRVEGFSREFITTKVARLLDVLREYKPEMKARLRNSKSKSFSLIFQSPITILEFVIR